jgi:hypothetical protein
MRCGESCQGPEFEVGLCGACDGDDDTVTIVLLRESDRAARQFGLGDDLVR